MRPRTKNKAFLKAYERGRFAFRDGDTINMNPYGIAPNGCHRRNAGTWGAVFRSYWRKGWIHEKKFRG